MEMLFEVRQGPSSSQKDVNQNRKWDKLQRIQPISTHDVAKTESSTFQQVYLPGIV